MNFRNKKVLIMGLGLHGGGVAVANWFIRQGAQVAITDLKSRKELSESLKKIQGKVTSYTFGKHTKSIFLWADIVIQNPAVPKESPFLKIAKNNGCQIENEASLFFKIVGKERIIGVTGTRGKSSTATFIYKILKSKFPKILLAGNIATTPMFRIIDTARKYKSPIVLELSSWHLENLGDQHISPHVAVVTNLLIDHLNRYKNLNSYYEAKKNIAFYQSKKDYTVLNFSDRNIKKIFKNPKTQVLFFSNSIGKKNGIFVKNKTLFERIKSQETKIIDVNDIPIFGTHNLLHIMAACCVARIYGLSHSFLSKQIFKLKALPSRQQLVTTVSEVRYINDTTATTPEAARQALETFHSKQGGKKIILIAGGSDKKIPQKKYDQLALLISKTCKRVILFQGSGSKKIFASLQKKNFAKHVDRRIQDMKTALACARKYAIEGDCILLSPGCASFGLFTHEFDRGRKFVEEVLKIQT